jgi:PAS domain S-box-containing protein
MAIHELTSNAARHGALSSPAGRLSVTWDIVRIDGARRLRLVWVESGGPPALAQAKQGFGSTLLQRVLTVQSFGTTANVAEGPDQRCGLPLLRAEHARRQIASGSIENAFATQALRESEARLRATQEHANIAIGEVDATGKFITVNGGFSTITGYSRAELLDRTLFDLTHPDDAQDERELFERHVAGELKAYAVEKRYVRKDGSAAWVAVSASAVFAPDGRYLYGAGSCRTSTRPSAPPNASTCSFGSFIIASGIRSRRVCGAHRGPGQDSHPPDRGLLADCLVEGHAPA